MCGARGGRRSKDERWRKAWRVGCGCARAGGLCLLGGLPNEVGQSEDVVPSAYAILKVPPERNAQLPAGLLQADKSIAATAAQLAPRAGADLPLLRPFSDIVLREVVVQRDFGTVQHSQ